MVCNRDPSSTTTHSTAKRPVGLVGAGLLGSALATRLLAAGYGMVGYDINTDCRRRLAGLGARSAESLEEVIKCSNRVIVCLPDSGVTAQVLPALEKLPPGALVIDTTTGTPDEMEDFARRLAACGTGYLDATVGGSSTQAARGEAILMVGATDTHFEQALDLLRAITPRVFHVGLPGQGARFKLVVNLVLGLNRLALAEGLAFAEACGLDPALTLEILKAGPAYSRAMDVKGRRMIERDYQPEARLRQHHKDVRLILAEAERRAIRLPATALHERLLEQAEAMGWAEADNSAIREIYRSGSAAEQDCHALG